VEFLTSPIVITDCLVASDGGSVWFKLLDAGGNGHSLVIPQHVVKENMDPAFPPGALILDGRALAAGAGDEKELIRALKGARIIPPVERKEITVRNEEITVTQTEEMREQTRAFIGRMVDETVSFVESPEYRKLTCSRREPVE
jgi:hypothetical protein